MEQNDKVCKVSQQEMDKLVDSLLSRFKKIMNSNGKRRIKEALMTQLRPTEFNKDLFFEIQDELHLIFSYTFDINWGAAKEPLLK
jgi:predicted AlkP superfamily phosphohydrolase/phosphomutase